MHCYRQSVSKQNKALMVRCIITKYLDLFFELLLCYPYLIKAFCKLHLMPLYFLRGKIMVIYI